MREAGERVLAGAAGTPPRRGWSWFDSDGAGEFQRRGVDQVAGLVHLGARLPAGCDFSVHDDVAGLPVEGAGQRGVETTLTSRDLPVAGELDQDWVVRCEVADGADGAGCGAASSAFELAGSDVVLVEGDVAGCGTV